MTQPDIFNGVVPSQNTPWDAALNAIPVPRQPDSSELRPNEDFLVDASLSVAREVGFHSGVDLARILFQNGRLFDTPPGPIEELFITAQFRNELAMSSARFAGREIAERAAHERELAKRDQLTGLFNRRTLEENFAELMQDINLDTQKRRSIDAMDTPDSVLIFDLDNFKAINDTWGHTAGDLVLMAAAGQLLELMRDTDRGYRYGGEELVVILRNTNEADAFIAAEKFRKAIASLKLRHQEKLIENISASVGVTSILPGDTFKETINRADQAMYAAKENGKNCTIRYSSLPAGWTPTKKSRS